MDQVTYPTQKLTRRDFIMAKKAIPKTIVLEAPKSYSMHVEVDEPVHITLETPLRYESAICVMDGVPLWTPCLHSCPIHPRLS